MVRAVRGLPEIELSYFFEKFADFRSAVTVSAAEQPAASLWPETARLAVVAPWFRVAAPARVFPRWDAAEVRKHAPDVLAAPVEILDRLLADPAPVQALDLFAVLALTGAGTPLASEDLRDRVWRALGVPLYVQFRGFHGELLARECERHEGLHVARESAAFDIRDSGELSITSLVNLRHPVFRLGTRLQSGFDTAVCGCGLPEPRLMGLRQMPVHTEGSLRALAAAVGTSGAAERPAAARMLS